MMYLPPLKVMPIYVPSQKPTTRLATSKFCYTLLDKVLFIFSTAFTYRSTRFGVGVAVVFVVRSILGTMLVNWKAGSKVVNHASTLLNEIYFSSSPPLRNGMC